MAYLSGELLRLKGHLTFYCLGLLVFLPTILHEDYRLCLQSEVPCDLWSKIM